MKGLPKEYVQALKDLKTKIDMYNLFIMFPEF